MHIKIFIASYIGHKRHGKGFRTVEGRRILTAESAADAAEMFLKALDAEWPTNDLPKLRIELIELGADSLNAMRRAFDVGTYEPPKMDGEPMRFILR